MGICYKRNEARAFPQFTYSTQLQYGPRSKSEKVLTGNGYRCLLNFTKQGSRLSCSPSLSCFFGLPSFFFYWWSFFFVERITTVSLNRRSWSETFLGLTLVRTSMLFRLLLETFVWEKHEEFHHFQYFSVLDVPVILHTSFSATWTQFSIEKPWERQTESSVTCNPHGAVLKSSNMF